MKYNMDPILKKIYFYVISILILFGCKEEDIIDPTINGPEKPPVTTMQLDFSSFPSSSTLPKITGKNDIYNTETKDNWGLAWIYGIAWKTIVEVGMSIPVAAFAESFNHDPIQREDGKWLWEYSFTPRNGLNHTASLVADVSNDGVVWEMYIAKESSFEDFLWFSGTSDLLGEEGTWTFYVEPNDPSPWLGIEWQRDEDNETGSIKYTNINTESDESGGYILYGLVDDPVYDAYFEIYDMKKDNLISIKWNRETHDGRILDNSHFGDNEWHCWDTNLENIECTN